MRIIALALVSALIGTPAVCAPVSWPEKKVRASDEAALVILNSKANDLETEMGKSLAISHDPMTSRCFMMLGQALGQAHLEIRQLSRISYIDEMSTDPVDEQTVSAQLAEVVKEAAIISQISRLQAGVAREGCEKDASVLNDAANLAGILNELDGIIASAKERLGTT